MFRGNRSFIVNRNFISFGHFDTRVIKMTSQRLTLAMLFFVLLFSCLVYRMVDLVLMRSGDHGVYKQNFALNNGGLKRQEIVDRNGVLLAINLVTASLYANPRFIDNPEEVADLLVDVLPDLNRATILNRIKSERKFVWIKRNLTPKQQYAVNGLGIPGLGFEREEKRVYPQGRLFSHVLGYVGVDGKGLSGIEKQFDKQLVQGDKDVTISLDTRLQTVLHNQLTYAMDEFQAKAAAGVVMDVNTGELLSLVSLPDYDPHHPSAASDWGRFNRTTLGLYEMGSTFKIFTMAMALDTKAVSLEDRFDVSKPIRKAGFTIRDTHPEKDEMGVSKIFMKSSNIGTAKVALEVGSDKQQEYLRKLGLFSPLSIELPEKSSPMLPARWSEIHSMTVSYGHGIAVTLVHVAQAVSTIVNGGIHHEATLLKQDKADMVLADYSKNIVIDADTSEIMRQLMYLTVEKGTGRRAKVKGYYVGGKTGTAEKSERGGYNRKSLISSFVGAFPIDKPQYVVIVMLDEPKGTKKTYGYATGGMTAAPVVGKVIEKIGPILLVGRSDMNPSVAGNYINYTISGEDNVHN